MNGIQEVGSSSLLGSTNEAYIMKLFLKLVVLTGIFIFSCSSNNSETCKVDYDCEGTLICNQVTHKCEPFVCKTNTDCVETGLICISNKCVPATISDKDAVDTTDLTLQQ